MSRLYCYTGYIKVDVTSVVHLAQKNDKMFANFCPLVIQIPETEIPEDELLFKEKKILDVL